MMSNGPITRRSLLKLAGTLAFSVVAVGYRHQPAYNRLLAGRLRSLVPHRAAAAALGVAYLAQVPAEASRDRLVAKLVEGQPSLAAFDRSQRRLGADLARRIRSDFAAGRTVSLHGWIVSVTEGRLAALVAIG
ncbi:MAG TPA: hypothetical protein VI277_09460 [Candidatus Limnocylindria bacterium]